MYSSYGSKFTPRTSTLVKVFIILSGVILFASYCSFPHSMTTNFPILILRLPYKLDRLSNDFVNASMEIIYNGPGENNTLPYPFDRGAINQTLNIAIHVRGQQSRNNAKLQYSIKTYNDQWEKEDVSLFGVPARDSWALYSASADPTLIRNKLAFYLSSMMGRYAPRMHFVEVFLVYKDEDVTYPASYRGVYEISEKITRGKSCVDIHKMKIDDEGKKSITGGYIFKVDKNDVPNPRAVAFQTNHTKNLFVAYPSHDVITPAKIEYLSSYLTDFETSLLDPHPEHHYSEYIDVDSWVDQLIMQEFTKNVDAYRISSYFYKDREGKIVSGPAWDLDRTWGNSVEPFAKYPPGWLYDKPITDGVHGIPFWWPTLMKDEDFVNKVVARWQQLRYVGGALSEPVIFDAINWFQQGLAKTGADKRENDKWGRWFAPFEVLWKGSYVSQLDKWIIERLAWMDAAVTVLQNARNHTVKPDL